MSFLLHHKPINVETENSVPAEGFRIGTGDCNRLVSRTKDKGAKQFWAHYEDIRILCENKAQHRNWGASKILQECPHLQLSSRRIKKCLESFYFSPEDGGLFYCSSEVSVLHKRGLIKDELVNTILVTHKHDHCQWETCCKTLRQHYYLVVRDTVQLLFKQNVKCAQCLKQALIPKTTLKRKMIRATYFGWKSGFRLQETGQKLIVPMEGNYNALNKDSSLFVNTLVRKGVLRIEVWKKKNLIQREQQFNVKLMWDLAPDFRRVLRMTCSARQSKGAKDLAVKIQHLNLEDIVQCTSFPCEEAASWTMHVKKKTYNCVATDVADMCGWVAAIRGAVAVQRSHGVSPLACYHVTLTDSPTVHGHGNVLLVFHPQFQPNQLLFRSPLSEATVHICDFSSIATFGVCSRTHHFWYTTVQNEQTVVQVNSVTVAHIARILRKYLEELVGKLETDDRLDRGFDRVAFRVPGRASRAWVDVPGVVLRQKEQKLVKSRYSCFPELEKILYGRQERPDIQDADAHYMMVMKARRPRPPSLPDMPPSQDAPATLPRSSRGHSLDGDYSDLDNYEVYHTPMSFPTEHYSSPAYTHASCSLYISPDNIYDEPKTANSDQDLGLPKFSTMPYSMSPVQQGGNLSDDYVDMDRDTNDDQTTGKDHSPNSSLNHHVFTRSSPLVTRRCLCPSHVQEQITPQAPLPKPAMPHMKSPRAAPRSPLRQKTTPASLSSPCCDNRTPPLLGTSGEQQGDSGHVHNQPSPPEEQNDDDYVSMNSPQSLPSPHFFTHRSSSEQECEDDGAGVDGNCSGGYDNRSGVSSRLLSESSVHGMSRCIHSTNMPNTPAFVRTQRHLALRHYAASAPSLHEKPSPVRPPLPRRRSFDSDQPINGSSAMKRQPPPKPPRRHLRSSNVDTEQSR